MSYLHQLVAGDKQQATKPLGFSNLNEKHAFGRIKWDDIGTRPKKLDFSLNRSIPSRIIASR
jgi:hypothetical protein